MSAVLIVEDDPYWQTILQSTLEGAGYAVEVTPDFLSAIRALQSLHPSAMVLDMVLEDNICWESDWQGWELARLARAQAVSTVVVSGHAEAHVSSRLFREFAVIDVFDKGYLVDHKSLFLQRVAEAVETTRRQRTDLAEKATAYTDDTDDQPYDKHGQVARLQFEVLGDETVIRMLRSSRGEPRGRFRPPFARNGLPHLLDAIHAQRTSISQLSQEERDVLRIDQAQAEDRDFLEQVGIHLYDALACEQVGIALTDMIDNARRTNTVGSLQIQFDEEAVELAQYPWELIHDGYYFLVHRCLSLVRYIACPIPVPRWRVLTTMRVLVVVPRPFGTAPLGDVEERAICSALEEANGTASFEFVRMPSPVTYEHMMTVLEETHRQGTPFDALHFDGHGDFGWRCRLCGDVICPEDEPSHSRSCSGASGKREGFVYFQHSTEGKDAVGATRMATALAGSGVQLVTLSACDTGKVEGRTLFNSLGPKLIGRLIPAVVAMQFPMKTSDTLPFFREFFKSLGAFDRIDTFAVESAVRDARKYIPSDRWFYPVLYLRAQEEKEGLL